MDPFEFPHYSLRSEILKMLEIVGKAEAGLLPAPGIVNFLNHVGPTIDGQAVAMVEALLETLWRDGLVGKVEAPSPNQFNAYCIRAAAETIAKQGVFIKLCPLAPQFQPKHKLRRLM